MTYIIKGEGEYSFLKFVDIVTGKSSGSIRSIPGICYRDNGEIVQNYSETRINQAGTGCSFANQIYLSCNFTDNLSCKGS
ncbi:MAG: hypothetical protein Q4F84_03790 [Fibrobacter sp.]|nr:hypothetical protein [Fibrobacter sp.]